MPQPARAGKQGPIRDMGDRTPPRIAATFWLSRAGFAYGWVRRLARRLARRLVRGLGRGLVRSRACDLARMDGPVRFCFGVTLGGRNAYLQAA